MNKQIITFVSLLVSVHVGFSQGTFQNLDFEAANPIPYGFPYPGAYMTTGSALPGWDAFIGTAPTPVVVLNGASTGGAEISIVNDNPLQGSYSAALFGGGVLPNSLEPASISQAGTVPAGTESIELDANVYGAQFTVTLGGEPVNMVPLDSFVHYTLWGGNIPPVMAGQIETLSISEPPPAGTPPSELQLDDIMFSPTAVTTPEPDALTLMSVGGLLFGLYRRFQSTRK